MKWAQGLLELREEFAEQQDGNGYAVADEKERHQENRAAKE